MPENNFKKQWFYFATSCFLQLLSYFYNQLHFATEQRYDYLT